MAKYYIPISSLNVENILSTESISPACFYQYRQFGDLPRGSQRFADLENYPKDPPRIAQPGAADAVRQNAQRAKDEDIKEVLEKLADALENRA